MISSPTFSQDNFGYAGWDQREPWAGFFGLYFPDGEATGWNAQLQFINQPQVWIVGGKYYELGNWFLELNTGPVFFKEKTRLSNWCFQVNLATGGRHSAWNVFLGNEFDPSLEGKYDEIIFVLHNVLKQAADGLYYGVSYEYFKCGDYQYLMPAIMLKYYVTDAFKVSVAPRGKTNGNSLNFNKIQWDNLYINMTYDFDF